MNLKKYYKGLFKTCVSIVGLALVSPILAQESVYNENFGFPLDKSTPLSTYTGYQAKSPIKYSGWVDVRNNKTSDTYSGASAGGNIYFNNGPMDFTISGIESSGYDNLTLSLGIWYQLQAGSTETTPIYGEFTIEYSTNNGSNYTKVAIGLTDPVKNPFILAPGETKDGNWVLASNIEIPSGVTNIRMSKSTDFVNYRIDDISIKGHKNVNGSLSSTTEALKFDTILAGTMQSKTIEIRGSNLKGNVTAQLAYGTYYRLSKSSFTKEEVAAGTTVTVTYNPTIASSTVDFINFTSTDANKLEIPIEGVSILDKPIAMKPKQYQISENGFVGGWNTVMGAEKYLVYIYTLIGSGEEKVLFNESFSKMTPKDGLKVGDCIDSKGGNMENFFENSGWTGEMVYIGSDDDLGSKEGVVRVGKKDQLGFITTPVVNLSTSRKTATVKFTMRQFARYGENDEMYILHLVNGVVRDTLDDLKNLYATKFEYSYQIPNPSATSQIRFQAKKNSDNRFILENVKIVQGGIQKKFARINKSAKDDVIYEEVTALTPGTEYHYAVRAYSSYSAYAPLSEYVSFTTLGDAPVTDPDYILGDANEDGKVNVSDVVTIVNDITGVPNAVFNFNAADMNEDGKINVSDVVSVVSIIIGSETPAAMSMTSRSLTLLQGAILIENRKLMINSSDDVHGFDFAYEGTLKEQEAIAGFKIIRYTKEGQTRILAYTMGKGVPANSATSLFKLKGDVEISDMLFVNNIGSEITLDQKSLSHSDTTSNPDDETTTSTDVTEKTTEPRLTSVNGGVEITGLPVGEKIEFFNIVGQLETSSIIVNGTTFIPIQKGTYIVKSKNFIDKVRINK